MTSYSAARCASPRRVATPFSFISDRHRLLSLGLLFLLLAATAAQAVPPDLVPIGNQSVREGANLNILLSAPDPDGDGVTFSASGLPGFCSLTDDGDATGDIDCNPLAGDAGNSNITITATDDSALPGPESASDNFVLTVSANTAPNIGNITNQSMAEGESLNILFSASDGDGDGMAFTDTGLPGFCVLTDNGNGTGNIACDPLAGDGGSYPVTIIVTDDAPIPLNDSDPFTLNVSANTAPVLTPIADQSVAEGASLNIPLSATEADGDGLAFSETGLPTFCSLTDNGNGTGSIACNPLAGDGGSYPVTVTVTDDAPVPANASDPFTLNVSANTPPVLTAIADQSVAEGESLNIPLNAMDPDGDGLAFSTGGLPGFCLLTDNGNGTGSIACNPLAGDGGSFNVTVTVTDDAPVPANASDLFVLNVSSNTPPNLTAIADQSVVEGDTLNIPLSATDADGDGLTFSQTGMPGFCLLNDNGNGTGSIDCSPLVGDGGTYPITVIVTDDGPVPANASDPFTLNVGANQAPTASSVTITGDPSLGSVLTAGYAYADAEDDLEGTSTFRWLRDGVAIPGAIAATYTVVVADVETALRFEVTPVAATGALQGTPVQSGELLISNSAPSITGQVVIDISEDTFREIVLADLVVVDLDSNDCLTTTDCTLIVQDGANYTRSGGNGNTITPDLDHELPLTVSVMVNDGFVNSPVFPLLVTILPVDDAPVITGLVVPLSTPEDVPLEIVLTDLNVTDPDLDDVYPTGFTLELQAGADYTVLAGIVTPAENFNGLLSIPAIVTDPDLLPSPIFLIAVDVTAENDIPALDSLIEPQTAIEDAPFLLDVSGNFSDADGDPLTFSATGLPPSLTISAAGTISGTPTFAEARDNDPYLVTVTARDPAGEFITGDLVLTVSALGRANLGLSIDVTPETASPGEQLRWTFQSVNPVGPAPGENVELTGSFVGNGLAVAVEGGANCTISVQGGGGRADFVCTLGLLPVAATTSIIFTTTTSQATEVVAFGTTEGTQPVPIDPNREDNSALRAVGVAESFSVGAAQILGNSSIRSVAAGDLNGDGAPDLVVGTSSGQPVQVYLGGALREACQCQRDFVVTPIPIPDTGSNEGVALADFDNNGTLDLVVANGGGQADVVYRNDGDGNFTLMATLAPSNGQDVAVGDFDSNGNMDIVIAANSPNPVYFGNGNGGFSAPTLLGDEISVGVAVGRFDGNNSDDLVFANVGSGSQVWIKNSGAGFTMGDPLPIGDAVSVAAADLNNDGVDDLVFARVPTAPGDIASNPVLLNQGAGTFGNPTISLGISPTNDVLIGDVSEDGSLDIVFINASGVHQIWTAAGIGYALHSEQIIDSGAVAGVLTDLGFADNGDPGGVDLAMGGDLTAGVGVYLNDSAGNLGRGDAVPPVITLLGAASVDVPSGNAYTDAGATALDNIDGDIVLGPPTSNVNTAIVGNYTVTYNVTDFAGNAATPVVRSVNVTPAVGRGGGGGGALGYWALAFLIGVHLLILMPARSRSQKS